MREAVAALPPRQRVAVVLRYFADCDIAATAEVMGCRPGTVRALTAQALERLRGAGFTSDDATGSEAWR